MAYIIKAEDPNFCGKGIAGVPFKEGEGRTESEWVATIAKELGHEVIQEGKQGK
jgi:hypothetical protein